MYGDDSIQILGGVNLKKIIVLLFAIMILTACSETTTNDYKFRGESENWQAEYAYTGTEKWGEKNGVKTYTNKDTFEFVLIYKGSVEELSALQKLEYSYETISSSGEAILEFTEPPTTVKFSSSGGATGGAKVADDEVIKVKVKWDDYEETFELHNNSK